MIKLLYGTEKKMIENFVHTYFQNKIYVTYDMSECDLSDVIIDASYVNLFNEEKNILVKNCDFFNSKSNVDTASLEKYLEDENTNTTILFISNNEDLDDRKKIVKIIKDKFEVKEFNKLYFTDLIKETKKLFEDYKIEDDLIKKIINLLNSEYSLIYNEVEKLKLYKIEDKVITLEDINEVISIPIEDNIIALGESLVNKNRKKSFIILSNLIHLKEDPIKIVVTLASQFRFLLQTLILFNDGYGENEISKKLSAHPYRVKMTLKNINNYTENKLIEILDKLAQLDYDIKTNAADKNIILENFILTI